MPADKEISFNNPRSTSRIREKLFSKTSSELSLLTEANELARCKDQSLATMHVSPLECVEYDASSNRLTTPLVSNGISLFNRLWNATAPWRFLKRSYLDLDLVFSRMEEIGRWLKLYHDSTRQAATNQEALDNALSLYLAKIATLRNLGIVNKAFLDRIQDRYVSEIHNLSDPGYQRDNFISFCRIQGDFAVANMLVDPEWHIYVLDFADSRMGTSIEDIARFYEQLWAMSQTSTHRNPILSRSLGAFLSGYGIPEEALQTNYFKSLFAYNGLISCITEYTTRPYIKYQLLTRMELKHITSVTMRRIAREIACNY